MTLPSSRAARMSAGQGAEPSDVLEACTTTKVPLTAITPWSVRTCQIRLRDRSIFLPDWKKWLR
jgi:hypothetical protein